MTQQFEIRKILTLANTPGQSLSAALWADHVADMFQAQVVLYSAVAPAPTEQDTSIGYQVNRYAVLLQSSLNRLKRLAQHLTRASQVRYISELGVPATNFLYHAQRENANLIVFNLPQSAEDVPASMDALLYGSPCPVFFARLGKTPILPEKILVPVRLKDGLEQKMPAVTAWAKVCNATVCLCNFVPYSATAAEREAVGRLNAQLRVTLESEGISVETYTARGRHFGQTMLRSVAATKSDMLAVVVEPANFVERLFKKMMGKYFLQHSPVPVLAVPILRRTVIEAGQTDSDALLGSTRPPHATSQPLNTGLGRPLVSLPEYTPMRQR
ncbi:MAG TPA: universal stress protein [Saprospiraceae bacterium]|nr:universal stress protein [Saprospiraceae bacterium]